MLVCGSRNACCHKRRNVISGSAKVTGMAAENPTVAPRVARQDGQKKEKRENNIKNLSVFLLVGQRVTSIFPSLVKKLSHAIFSLRVFAL
jgi:hypothetical protein